MKKKNKTLIEKIALFIMSMAVGAFGATLGVVTTTFIGLFVEIPVLIGLVVCFGSAWFVVSIFIRNVEQSGYFEELNKERRRVKDTMRVWAGAKK